MNEKRKMRVNLRGLKRWAWKADMSGFFSVNGKELTDKQVRELIDWAIGRGCIYDTCIDINKAARELKF